MTTDSLNCAPDDPGPLLDLAHAFESRGNGALGFALRWCAGRKLRVFERTDVKRLPRFQWIRQQPKYVSFTRKELAARATAVLPPVLFVAMDWKDPVIAFETALDAYRWLAEALKRLSAITVAPAPPPRKLVSWRCAECGIDRPVGVPRCEVCGNTSKTEVRS